MGKVNRPNEHDDAVCQIAAEKIWPRVKQWLGDDARDDEAEIKALARAVRGEGDGYKIARGLERDGWDPNAELVDILDNAGAAKYRACDELTKKWVAENEIKPAFAVGAQVKFKENRFSKTSQTGEVTKIEEDRAMYWIFCAELGHVREGCGTHATILPYEHVEAA